MSRPQTAGHSLEGQSALVTGGSSGIGEGIARALAAAGAKVAVNYHSHRGQAEAIVADIKSAGGQAVALGADVSDGPAVTRLVEDVVSAFGRIDILVASSGIQKDASFTEMTLAEWNAVIGLNLTGCFLSAQAALRRFDVQDARPDLSAARGKIVFVSSVHEVVPWAGHVNYASAKGGLRMLTRSLAQEVAARRVRVNAVAPGAIETPINADVLGDEEKRRGVLGLIPYGRIGKASDVGKATTWLVSDDSDYVTGHTLFVDGGMSLYPGFIGNG
jgi:glucose 1-dehydrogenase